MRICPFISYAKEDADVAMRLYEDLRRRGARPWLDIHNLRGGQDWAEVALRAIRESSHVIVLVSANSVEKQGFVQREIRKALDLLEEFPPDAVFVVPVRLDNSEPKHERLARLHWIDLFDGYDDGLARLASTLGLPRRSATGRIESGNDENPRVFVSIAGNDDTKIGQLISTLRDNNFTPVLRGLRRFAVTWVDGADVLANDLETCGAFISVQLKHEDYRLVSNGVQRYALPQVLMVDEVLAWANGIGLLVRLRDAAIDNPSHNENVLTYVFSSDDDFERVLGEVASVLRKFFYGEGVKAAPTS